MNAIKHKNKIIKAALLFLAIICLTACSNSGSGQTGSGNAGAAQSSGNADAAQSNGSADHIRIITTIFPEYDWVRNVLGENPAGIDLTLLIDNGVDPHSFQPSVEDIMKIGTCDLLVYVGGESDKWVADVLKQPGSERVKQLNLMQILGDRAKTEEIVEGMEGHEDHESHEDHEDHENHVNHEDHEDHEDHEEAEEYDEHVWLSLRNAETFTASIAKSLSELDPENAETYQKNAEAYQAELQKLDSEYTEAVANGAQNTLLFGDRFPFRYLTEDYGLEYYAAFAGCSAETEASFETITFLAQKTDELGLKTVLTIDGSDQRIAETIISATKEKNQKILEMDSMQSVSRKDLEAGTDYLHIMRHDLEILKQALQ